MYIVIWIRIRRRLARGAVLLEGEKSAIQHGVAHGCSLHLFSVFVIGSRTG